LQSGGDSQLGGASGNYDIALQPNWPPLTNNKQVGFNQQKLPDLREHLCQEVTPLRDIYQENLKQILTEYSDKEAELIVNTYTQLKPWLNYTVLHKTERKELATKATYLTLSVAYMFVSALLQP